MIVVECCMVPCDVVCDSWEEQATIELEKQIEKREMDMKETEQVPCSESPRVISRKKIWYVTLCYVMLMRFINALSCRMSYYADISGAVGWFGKHFFGFCIPK